MSRPVIGVDASRCFKRQPTGTENYARRILQGLLELEAAPTYEWRLYVNTPPPIPGAPWMSLAHATPIWLPRVRMWTHRALAREVRRNPPHALFVPAHVLPFAWRPRAAPPAVMTVHDLGYMHFPEAHRPWARRYLRWTTGYAVRRACRLICVSRATRADVMKFHGAEASRLDVIPEGCIARDRPAPEPAAACRQALGLERDYALFLSTLQPRKNVERLIRSYARLAQTEALDWDLALAGQLGWLSQPILRAVEQSPARRRIHVLGYVDEVQAAALYAGARFFCYPSLHEGFGLPVLEAQTLGTPVMTSRHSALPEVAGDAALLVDPEDEEEIAQAMLRLSRDEKLRQTLIQKGYANVKRFSWEKAARATLAVLEKAMQRDP